VSSSFVYRMLKHSAVVKRRAPLNNKSLSASKCHVTGKSVLGGTRGVGATIAGATIAGATIAGATIAGVMMVINLLQHQLVGKMTATSAMR
jgi:hypothetical protein